MSRITVFSGVERRRRWGDDEKLAMVEASLVPGGSVARIARERIVSRDVVYVLLVAKLTGRALITSAVAAGQLRGWSSAIFG